VLAGLLDRAGTNGPPVSAVAGLAGVGKTIWPFTPGTPPCRRRGEGRVGPGG
jgi:hypothetical protein